MSTRREKERGDEFDELAASHMDRLFAAALRLTRSVPDAEDLVQETLLRAFAAFDRIDPSLNMKAYLFRVLTNIFINEYRHRKIVRRVDDMARAGLLDGSLYSSDSQRIWADPHVRYLHTHLSDQVLAALDSLADRFRQVLVMSDLMDFTYTEIADQLGIPAGTVMSRLFRARRYMRLALRGVVRRPGSKASSAG